MAYRIKRRRRGGLPALRLTMLAVHLDTACVRWCVWERRRISDEQRAQVEERHVAQYGPAVRLRWVECLLSQGAAMRSAKRFRLRTRRKTRSLWDTLASRPIERGPDETNSSRTKYTRALERA